MTDVESSAKPLDGPPGGGRAEGVGILIAEDHAEMADVLRTYLTAVGYAVAVARDGIEAGALAVQLKPAVAILDANMPGCSGWALLRAWKRGDMAAPGPVAIPQPGRAPAVIMLTGDDVFPPEAALADVVLRKPASLRSIAAAVAAQLGTSAP